MKLFKLHLSYCVYHIEFLLESHSYLNVKISVFVTVLSPTFNYGLVHIGNVTLSRRSLRWMSSTKEKYLLHQENKTNNERLSLDVPHLELSTALNIFISGVASWILML